MNRFVPGQLVFARSTHTSSPVTTLWAGHTSRAVVYQEDVWDVAETVDPRAASLAVMPAAAWLGLRLTGLKRGDLIVVIGQGMIGQMAAQLAIYLGARVIGTDIHDERLAMSCRHTGIVVVNPSKADVREAVLSEAAEGADVVVDTSSCTDAVNESFTYIRDGGRYCLQGVYPGKTCLDLYVAQRKQVTFYCPYGCEGIAEMLGLLASGVLRIAPLITDVVPFLEAPGLYERMITDPSKMLGIVVDWSASTGRDFRDQTGFAESPNC